MSRVFNLPNLGEGLTEGVLVEWKVKEGDQVEANQPLADIETDKSVSELTSPHAGRIAKLHWQAGDAVPVGQPLVTFDGEGAEKLAEPAKTVPAAESPGKQREHPREVKAEKPNESNRGIEHPTINHTPVDTTNREEAEAEGVMLDAQDESVEVEASGTGNSKDHNGAAVSGAARPPAREPQPAQETQNLDAAAARTSRPQNRRSVLASPATRQRARELNVDLESIQGTGPGGRITTEDIERHARNGRPSTQRAEPTEAAPTSGGPPAMPDFSQFGPIAKEKISPIRKRIAQKMDTSVRTAAHVWQMDEADVTDLDTFRRQAQARAGEHSIKLSLLPYIMKAAVAALRDHPHFNASYDAAGGEIVVKKYYHLGIAVDSPQGLMVPVVRDVDHKSIMRLAGELQDLSQSVRDGKIKAEQLRGSSFTITNLGSLGGTAFTPIINWPEVSILGVARMREQPVYRNGELLPRKVLPLVVGYDHRLIDGAQAARFLNDIKRYLEDPSLLLIEA